MYSSVWIALGGYAAERNHGYITGLLLVLGSYHVATPASAEAGAAAEGEQGAATELRGGSGNPEVAA